MAEDEDIGGTLFPVVEVPDVGEEEVSRYDTDYKPSVAWDYELGDFVRDGTNNMVKCDGREAYKTWCVKTVLTDRYVHLAYPSSIGTELDAAVADPDEETVESELARTITEAIEVNPRTEYVRGFSFEWEADSIRVRFHVKGIELEEFVVSVDLGNGREE